MSWFGASGGREREPPPRWQPYNRLPPEWTVLESCRLLDFVFFRVPQLLVMVRKFYDFAGQNSNRFIFPKTSTVAFSPHSCQPNRGADRRVACPFDVLSDSSVSQRYKDKCKNFMHMHCVG